MKSKKNIVFLGMMGSGKSSIGLMVSKKLNLEFIDIDNKIEKKTGIKIAKIFEKRGEKFFREIEEDLTLKILNNKKTVISLGGGAFLNKKIKKEVLENHLSFWLNWDTSTLINRIKGSKKRPLALKLSKNELIQLIKTRSVIYAKSQFKINCENLSKIEIVNIILKIYETN